MSSPSGFVPASSDFRVCGTAMTNLNPTTVGWAFDSVTVPITSARRTISPPSLIANSDHGPAHRRLAIADQIPGRDAVARNQHELVRPRANAIDHQKRFAVGLLAFVQRLHEQQLPAFKACMLHCGDSGSNYAANLH